MPDRGDRPAVEPTGKVIAVVRRAEVALNVPTDKAWTLIDEYVVLPLERGAWNGNGLRIGVMPLDQLDAYGELMPEPLASSQMIVSKSESMVSIMQTPLLSSNLQFEVDLTRPPKPMQFEPVLGGKNSRLRLLARVETADDGRHVLAIKPQHFVPAPFDLLPRDPLEKELDGRVFDELALKLPLGTDQIAVIGLYWPWPEELRRVIEEAEAAEAEDAETSEQNAAESDADPEEESDPTSEEPQDPEEEPATNPLPPAELNDPAAPPPHLQGLGPIQRQPINSEQPTSVEADWIAPPLPLHFGSTLMAGRKFSGQATRTVLLITIEER